VGIIAPVPLARAHGVDDFDCGHPELNEWLVRFAWANHRANAAKTFVLLDTDNVVGYYSLSAGEVGYEKAPLRMVKGLARHPVPVVILAKLAIDRSHQGRGFGKLLLRDALLRAAKTSEQIGIRAVLVSAKNETARTFYEHHEFDPLPGDSLRLVLLIKDLKNLIK
jgi:GNAT superfamily N-acetyltransferase